MNTYFYDVGIFKLLANKRYNAFTAYGHLRFAALRPTLRVVIPRTHGKYRVLTGSIMYDKMIWYFISINKSIPNVLSAV